LKFRYALIAILTMPGVIGFFVIRVSIKFIKRTARKK